MSATNYFETAILALIFNGDTITNIADNASTSPATNFYISLHTADPGETGSQSTSEANYTSYDRVAVARTSSGFTVSGNEITNTSAVTFPTATGGSNTATHFGIGLDSAGAGTLLFSGPLDASLAISNGITPSFQSGELHTTAD